MAWCQTDLAANAYRWSKLLEEDLRYGPLDRGAGASHDGFMAQAVRDRGWKVRGALRTARGGGGAAGCTTTQPATNAGPASGGRPML